MQLLILMQHAKISNIVYFFSKMMLRAHCTVNANFNTDISQF